MFGMGLCVQEREADVRRKKAGHDGALAAYQVGQQQQAAAFKAVHVMEHEN